MSDEGSSTTRPKGPEASESQFPEIIPETENIESVVVFDGIAEITRNIKITPEQVPEAGEYNVVVKGIPKTMINTSLRVNGAKGAATILEVIPKESTADEEEIAKLTGTVKEAYEKLKELVKKADISLSDIDVIQESLTWLDGWMKNIAGTPSAAPLPGAPPPKPFLDGGYLENVGKFIEFYAKQSVEKKKALLVEERKFVEICKDISEQIHIMIKAGFAPTPVLSSFYQIFDGPDIPETKTVRENFGGVRSFADDRTGSVKICSTARPDKSMNIYVHLRAEKGAKIIFKLVYNVEGGSWKPDYTARISEGKSLELTYSAIVKNSTGEDWKDVKMALSTAIPSSVSEPEDPGCVYVSLSHDEEPIVASRNGAAKMCKSFRAAGMEERSANVMAKTRAARGLVSSLFSVPLRTTIKADGDSHKVGVSVIESISITLEYVIYPRTSGNSAYIHILGKNSSEYPLLPGDCGVFIDGSFVTQTPIKYIPVDGDFEMFCGIDNDVHVEYTKPVLVKDKKGVVMKTNIENYVGSCTIRNDKETKVTVIFKEPIPQSSDESVVVKLKEPVIEEGGKAVIDPATNFLVWTATIEPGKEEKISIEISVEWPTSKLLRYTSY